MKESAKSEIRGIDLYAGAGGSSSGAVKAGVKIVAAVDNWSLARKTYLDNFEGVEFLGRRSESLRLKKLVKRIGPIQLLIASPECTSHTCAKGSARRSERSRETATQVIRFAKAFGPRWIVVENVIQMRGWKRYTKWVSELRRLGYQCREQVLNAADFGVAQSRRRLFIVCDRMATPPLVKSLSPLRFAAQNVIDANGKYSFSALRVPGRAKATLARADRAVRSVGKKQAFLLVYYGSDGSGGWQEVSKPLRTITTVDRFAYVRPKRNGGLEMRMLQVPELQKAMGFPPDYKLDHGTRRDKIKLLGNAVCPPVMAAVISALTISDGNS